MVTGVQIMLRMVEIFSQEVTLQIRILRRHVIEEVGGVDADVLDLTLLQAWVRNLRITGGVAVTPTFRGFITPTS